MKNVRSGIVSVGLSTVRVTGNTIQESATGVVIRDPGEPSFRDNEVSKNSVQVAMEKKAAKKLWTTYQKENPKISGANSIPQATCSIF